MSQAVQSEAIPAGVVTTAAVDSVTASASWTNMQRYAQRWADEHASLLAAHGGAWSGVPLDQWSRRFEYPFSLDAVARHGRPRPRVLDAGSGFTFFPYLLADELEATVTAADYADLKDYFKDSPRAPAPVSFLQTDLSAMPLPDDSFDAVVCVSVLEHMSDPQSVVDEFHRVLAKGGIAVITMDLSLDGQAQITVAAAIELTNRLAERFALVAAPALTVADAYAGGTLTTRNASPELLPWRHPKLYGAATRARARRFPLPRVLDLACYCAVYRKET